METKELPLGSTAIHPSPKGEGLSPRFGKSKYDKADISNLLAYKAVPRSLMNSQDLECGALHHRI